MSELNNPTLDCDRPAAPYTYLVASLETPPEGRADNSPAFQGWVQALVQGQVPKGRQKSPPPPMKSLRDRSMRFAITPPSPVAATSVVPRRTKHLGIQSVQKPKSSTSPPRIHERFEFVGFRPSAPSGSFRFHSPA